MAKEYQYQVITDPKNTSVQNNNNELLKSIIREQNAEIQAALKRIKDLESK